MTNIGPLFMDWCIRAKLFRWTRIVGNIIYL